MLRSSINVWEKGEPSSRVEVAKLFKDDLTLLIISQELRLN